MLRCQYQKQFGLSPLRNELIKEITYPQINKKNLDITYLHLHLLASTLMARKWVRKVTMNHNIGRYG